jgi:hypothetical protein
MLHNQCLFMVLIQVLVRFVMSKFQMIIINFRRIWLNLTPGTGEEVPLAIVKLMLLLNSIFELWCSGIQLQTVERLIAFIIMTFYLSFIRKDR